MDELQDVLKQHAMIMKATTALFYGILVSIAMNFFWEPGHIYSSGITGLAQLIGTLTKNGPVHLSTALMLFVLNIPLFVLGWRQIGHRFTLFTILAVFCSSVMIKAINPVPLTKDPIICAIFGATINGFGTGLALKNGISTGGFYSALSIFINARVMDMVYTKQQKMQVMIVTTKPKSVIDCIQNRMRRGITIVHGAEGAYKHDEKTILFTVISRYEQPELRRAMIESDPDAFVSIADNVHIMGRFYEPEP